jgi:preprotein translocase subunit YajC
MPQLLFAVVTFALMWLLLIRPQQQRVRAQQQVVASLKVGDEVVTAGGVFGRVAGLDETTDPPSVRLEVADGVVIRLATAAIARPTGARPPEPPEGPDVPDANDQAG